MKLLVTKGFVDKETNIFRQIGQEVEYPEARAKEIETRGFGKCLEEPKPTKTTKESKEPVKEELEKPKKVTRKK